MAPKTRLDRKSGPEATAAAVAVDFAMKLRLLML